MSQLLRTLVEQLSQLFYTFTLVPDPLLTVFTMIEISRLLALLVGFSLALMCSSAVIAQDDKTKDDAAGSVEQEATKTVELADGALTLEVPDKWMGVDPKFNMIEAEFSIAAEEGDEQKGRLTIMAAGGSAEANIDRWAGQFSQPDGGSVKDSMTVEETEVAGFTTHMVDLSGSYADREGGPTSPPVMRENFRMLAAVIETDQWGSYFIKFYGGAETVEANREAFHAMVKSLTVK